MPRRRTRRLFSESAHSNESKLRLLEERMKRPQSTAQMSDAVRRARPSRTRTTTTTTTSAASGCTTLTPRKQRRGSGPSPASPLGGNPKSASAKAADGSLGGKQSIENYFRPRDGVRRLPPAPPLFTTPRTAPEPSGKKTIPREAPGRRRGERPRPARQREPRRSRVGRRAGASARGGEARGGRIEAKGIEARVGSGVGVFPRDALAR